MSLLSLPISTAATVVSVDAGSLTELYRVAGLAPARSVRVLARYGGRTEPRFLEVELDGSHVVTVPSTLADRITVLAA